MRLAVARVLPFASLDRDPARAFTDRARLGFGHAARKTVFGAAVETAYELVPLGLLSLLHTRTDAASAANLRR